MNEIISLAIGYFFGCIQPAYIFGKLRNIDIREHGSGNSGTTNAKRVLGNKTAAIVFCIDILKSCVAYVICEKLFGKGIYAGFGVIIGHDFPVFLKFRGGKGIASTIGLILVYDWKVGMLACLIGAVSVFISRMVSVGSIAFLISIPIFYFAIHKTITLWFIAIALIGIAQHHQNITRIIQKREHLLSPKQ